MKLASSESSDEIAEKLLQAHKGHDLLPIWKYDLEFSKTEQPAMVGLWLLTAKQGFVLIIRPITSWVWRWESEKRDLESLLIEYSSKYPWDNPTHVRRLFWKIIGVAEFVAFKQQVYNDYAQRLRDEITMLKDSRISLRRKLRNEDLLTLSVYDERIPLFLKALDDITHIAFGWHRWMYSVLSNTIDLDAQRDKVKERLAEWIEEVDKWDPPLVAIWKKAISPLTSLFARG